jgi:hypothetical protein
MIILRRQGLKSFGFALAFGGIANSARVASNEQRPEAGARSRDSTIVAPRTPGGDALRGGRGMGGVVVPSVFWAFALPFGIAEAIKAPTIKPRKINLISTEISHRRFIPWKVPNVQCCPGIPS